MADLDGGPALLIAGEKITASHRARDAYVYVRQSTLLQVRVHTESLARQYDLRQRAMALGWPAHQVVVIAGRGSPSWSPTSGWARPGSSWHWRCRGWPGRTPTGTSCWTCAR